jgi:hypothetical protein
MEVPQCRHIMANGAKCHAPALGGTHFCYFHSKLHKSAKQPPNPMASIEIPLVFEDRCALLLAISQVLRATVNNSIDRHRAYILLYGLQLASRNIDPSSWSIPSKTVDEVSHTPEGDELAPSEFRYEQDDDEDKKDDPRDDDQKQDAQEQEETNIMMRARKAFG